LAFEALEAIAPDVGLIFGRFEYLKELRKAALGSGIDEHRAKYLTLRDLRHATATDLIEHTEDLAAAAYVLGHRDLRTTSRYAHARRRAADRALRARAAADHEIMGPGLGPTTVPRRTLVATAGLIDPQEKPGKTECHRESVCPPEAEVGGSNPFASASDGRIISSTAA
jgi:hypothetical protein